MAEYLQPEKKQELFEKYGKTAADTGSPESQVALFTYRIAHLTEHVKKNKKDVVTRRSLLRLVGKRRQILDYLKEIDIERYRKIVKELGLRR
ncbi:MAG: 30S ribosomal protein S15 [Bacteroidales bacterium]|nr:30S ribosomal protein S15 [Bacteroidales bacterium]